MTALLQEKAPLAGEAQTAQIAGIGESDNSNPAVAGNSAGLVGRWGAAAGDWDHLDFACELTEDLLPVVSNPNAVKSPDSKIAGPGKTPSRYNGRGQMAGFTEWTQYRATGEDIARWSKQPDYGICIQTRRIRAIDVDVEDAEEADRIFRAIERHVTGLPLRNRRDSTKFLLAFELVGDFTKRRFATEHGVIEFLAFGQQFVACGTHPKGARYEWPDGLPAIFPKLTAEQFEAIWSDLHKQFGKEASVEARTGIAPLTKRQAADIADDTVRFLVENWTVYGVDRSGRVDILCPWESEHTSDSGESATSYFPAGVGGFDQGHFKCQHAHCLHRADSDYIAAIGLGAADFEVIVEQYDPPPLPAFKRTTKGQIDASRENTTLALARPDLCGVKLRHDSFRDEIMLAPAGTDDWRPFKDTDYHRVGITLERGGAGFVRIPKEMMRDSVAYVAEGCQFDSAIYWLESLRWDRVPRVERFLVDYFGATDTPYHREVALYLWSALAARILVPGTKADMVPVAVGAQGVKKSSTIAAIVPSPDFFLELDLGRRDDDLARLMRGKLIVELGELKGLRARQVEHVKAFITRQYEEWTPKFREMNTRYARRCIFFGSTNREEFLADDTGNRRWLPFDACECDPNGVAAIRDQLWAEARELFKARGVIWQEAEQLARAEHGRYVVHEEWEEAVRRWVDEEYQICDDKGEVQYETTPRQTPFTAVAALVGAVGFSLQDVAKNKGLKDRMACTLKAIGFAANRKYVGGDRGRYYSPVV